MEDSVPSLYWSAAIDLLHFNSSSWPLQLRIVKNIKASACFFLESEAADFVDTKHILSILLSQSLLSHLLFHVISHFKSSFFVFFTKVSFVQPLFILNLHIHRIIHQPLILYGYWQFSYLVPAMHLHLSLSFCNEIGLFLAVAILNINWIKIMSFPVFLCSFCTVDLLVC